MSITPIKEAEVAVRDATPKWAVLEHNAKLTAKQINVAIVALFEALAAIDGVPVAEVVEAFVDGYKNG